MALCASACGPPLPFPDLFRGSLGAGGRAARAPHSVCGEAIRLRTNAGFGAIAVERECRARRAGRCFTFARSRRLLLCLAYCGRP
uniref:Uncharacterized protein n=1 Tax=Setaria italica TaxID=4555 RepID=K3YNS5_SETIT